MTRMSVTLQMTKLKTKAQVPLSSIKKISVEQPIIRP